MSASLTILAPMAVEARAVRSGAPWAQVQKVGMGPRRAAASAVTAGDAPGPALLLAGFCGALSAGLAPGDIVLASELRGPSGEVSACADPAVLAGVLRRAGMRVHVGPIASSEKIVRGEARQRLGRTGAVAVDMESVWLAGAARDRPFIALRVVLDTGARELHRPLRTLNGFTTAYRALRRACALAQEWTQALGPRDIVLASPRASCAGVDRAIEIVRGAVEERRGPVYVRKQIVHNAHVIAELEAAGAVFVSELDEVPSGATVIFSAHGVSPAVRADAAARDLEVIDATCPLVAKVHAEARRFAGDAFDIVLVGHEGHEEIEGTFGEAPARTQVIESVSEVAGLSVERPAAGRVPDPDHARRRRDRRGRRRRFARTASRRSSGRPRRTSVTRPRTARTRSASWRRSAISCSSSGRPTRQTRGGWSRSRSGPAVPRG